MMEMISARRSSHEIAPHDILSMLIEAMDNKENSSDELDHQGLLGAYHCIRRDMAYPLKSLLRQYIHDLVRGWVIILH